MKLSICFFLVMSILGSANAQEKFIGTWSGTLNVGPGLRMIIHVKKDAKGALQATMDSPDQKAKDIPFTSVRVNGDSLITYMTKLQGGYSGSLIDDTHISGIWEQRGRSIAINLVKGELETKINNAPNRPQTPVPPYPYKSIDTVYFNKDKSQQFGATLTMPNGAGPFPTILLITGSGLQNRDEEIMGHKPFAVLADFFTKKGYAVLRVDDRSIGKSTGDVKNATSADFANDASCSVDFLLTIKEVDKKKIGLLGHSEGGMIAPMVANKRKDIAFIVMMAGVGEKVATLMTEQNEMVMLSYGIDTPSVKAYAPLYNKIITLIASSKETDDLTPAISKIVDNWIIKHDTAMVNKFVGSVSGGDNKKFAEQFASLNKQKWSHFFFSYDPTNDLRKLHCKVLAIDGSRDIQVKASTNLAAIKANLAKSKSPAYEVKELEGLNHLFQTCIKCTTAEYKDLEETISPVALNTIGDWLAKNIK
jgi:uncharacterized protein